MTRKHKAVVINKDTARIYTNTSSRALSKIKGAVLDPDLSKVKGVKLEFWKKTRKGEIVSMSRPEKLIKRARLKGQKKNVNITYIYRFTKGEAVVFHSVIGFIIASIIVALIRSV